VGLAGLVFEHVFRVIFGRPVYAAVFLVINGLILLAGERFRSRGSLAAEEQIAAEREYALDGVGWAHARSYPGEARYAAGEARRAASRGDLRLEEMGNAVESDERLSRMGYGQAVIIGSAATSRPAPSPRSASTASSRGWPASPISTWSGSL